MDIKELDNIDLYKEQEHWWIKTRFLYIDKAIEFLEKNSQDLTILEIGSGSGQNLSFLENNSNFRNVIKSAVGVDVHLPQNFTRRDLTEKTQMTKELPVSNQKYDLVILMDVIEHVDDSVSLLMQAKSFLKDGGALLVTVPAFNFLWSNHDIILGHRKRYTTKMLRDELSSTELKEKYLRYAFSFVFPLVYLVRKLVKSKSNETDLKLPHPFVNTLLYLFGKLEVLFNGSRYVGTSVVGIYVKES